MNPGAQVFAMADLSTPWALRTAVTLGVPDLIGTGVDDATGLAAATGADPGAMLRLLRHLTARGVLAETAPARYALTEAGETLRAGHPSRMADWLDMSGAAGRMDEVWARLPGVVRSGRPAHEQVHGRPLYADFAGTPDLQASFDRLMSADAVDYGGMLAEYDWSEATHVVDVGGGRGDLLAALLQAHPHLRGTLFEQQDTLAAAEPVLAPLGDRVARVAGDFLTDPLPVGADHYVLASVLHNWDDEHATAILRAVADAAAPGARVLVVEGRPEDSGWATHLDLKMLVLLGGRERTDDDLAELTAVVGLEPAGAVPCPRGPFGVTYEVRAFAVADERGTVR
ncbi:methyltransferase [Saccharopolyspora sp. CA-218241]|uniref:methyltransferase n=1 Tax=Saccharopolyspora sp. CA-218241 TaxID=3240027 RepID=UPI003D980FE2